MVKFSNEIKKYCEKNNINVQISFDITESINYFSGIKRIYKNDKLIYELKYNSGLIKWQKN